MLQEILIDWAMFIEANWCIIFHIEFNKFEKVILEVVQQDNSRIFVFVHVYVWQSEAL